MKIFLTISCLLVLDFLSKFWIFENIRLNSFIYLNKYIYITHIHNFGISFGLFSRQLPAIVFVIIGLIITGFIFIIYLKSKKQIEKWSLILIIAGALSNIFDRAINGFVIDFIYLHYEEFYWPAFNFADIYITIGICMLLFIFLQDIQKKGFKQK